MTSPFNKQTNMNINKIKVAAFEYLETKENTLKDRIHSIPTARNIEVYGEPCIIQFRCKSTTCTKIKVHRL